MSSRAVERIKRSVLFAFVAVSTLQYSSQVSGIRIQPSQPTVVHYLKVPNKCVETVVRGHGEILSDDA